MCIRDRYIDDVVASLAGDNAVLIITPNEKTAIEVAKNIDNKLD